jgi:hypothetical protein
MNKIIEIKSVVLLWDILEVSNTNQIPPKMLNLFGMERTQNNTYFYIIRDESKAILFMLKYPEQIERIFHK